MHNIYAATPDAAWSHFTSLLVPTFALRRDLLKASFERIAARVPLVEGKQNKKTKKRRRSCQGSFGPLPISTGWEPRILAGGWSLG